jgi:hypothetical protein
MKSPKDEEKRPASEELLLELPRLTEARSAERVRSLAAQHSEVLWRSCCAEMDSRALLFFSQLVISLVVLLFAIYEIATLPDAAERSWSEMTATFIIGVWLPSPRANK